MSEWFYIENQAASQSFMLYDCGPSGFPDGRMRFAVRDGVAITSYRLDRDKVAQLRDTLSEWLEGDPDPQEAGHPDRPAHGRLMAEMTRKPVIDPHCLSCEHSWADHTVGSCWGAGLPDPDGRGYYCHCTQDRPE